MQNILPILRATNRKDLGITNLIILIYLSQAPDNTGRLKELAKATGTGPACITGQIDRLERLGYIIRKAAPGDRRGIIATLTPQAHQFLTSPEGPDYDPQTVAFKSQPKQSTNC